MRAIEARKLYIEDHIEFEHLTRRLARVLIPEYTSKDKSLNTVINDLIVFNSFSKLDLPIHKLIIHKRMRNWLVHRPKNAVVPEMHLEFMVLMKAQNSNISKIIKNSRSLEMYSRSKRP